MEDQRDETIGDEENMQFTGTLFVLTIFLMFLGGMWAAVYFMLLER